MTFSRCVIQLKRGGGGAKCASFKSACTDVMSLIIRSSTLWFSFVYLQIPLICKYMYCLITVSIAGNYRSISKLSAFIYTLRRITVDHTLINIIWIKAQVSGGLLRYLGGGVQTIKRARCSDKFRFHIISSQITN